MFHEADHMVDGVHAVEMMLVCPSRGARQHSVGGKCGGACRKWRASLMNIYM